MTENYEKLLLQCNYNYHCTYVVDTFSRDMNHAKVVEHTVFHAIYISIISDSETLNESSKSEQALKEAMKAGFVRVNTTNILVFGMAGTGKTSTKHLLLGLPPPVDRNSTPLASPAERICNRNIRETTKMKMEAQEDPSRT